MCVEANHELIEAPFITHVSIASRFVKLTAWMTDVSRGSFSALPGQLTPPGEGVMLKMMRSTKKGNPWNFGMKTHIGAYADRGLVHNLIFTQAKVAGHNKVIDQLLRGEDTSMHDDKACTTRQLNLKQLNLLASDPEKGSIRYIPFKKSVGEKRAEWKQAINCQLSSPRSVVEKALIKSGASKLW